MERFAFVLHPLSLEDMQMVSPMVRYVPDFLLEYILKQKKPSSRLRICLRAF